jgi:TRAP transporter TAXI family solute receptor
LLGRGAAVSIGAAAGQQRLTNGWHSVSVTRASAAAFCVVALLFAVRAAAGEPASSITIRAGKIDSAYHTLARQFAEAVAVAGNGAFTLEVEESQGSVQNIMEATKREGNYIFTAPPNLIAQAKRGEKPFERNPRYGDIRALFPIPSQTMHWVVRQDSGVHSLADLAGRSFIPGGKGSFSERFTVTMLQALKLDGQVQLIDIDVGAAPTAVLSNQVSGIALAGTFPLPTVLDLARATPIRLLSLTRDDLAAVLAADDSTVAQVVPKGTYPGVDYDVTTVALPAGAYATRRMSDATAYAVTKAFWSQSAALGERNPPWHAVTPAAIGTLGVRLHKGALRYYAEAGVTVPAALR